MHAYMACVTISASCYLSGKSTLISLFDVQLVLDWFQLHDTHTQARLSLYVRSWPSSQEVRGSICILAVVGLFAPPKSLSLSGRTVTTCYKGIIKLLLIDIPVRTTESLHFHRQLIYMYFSIHFYTGFIVRVLFYRVNERLFLVVRLCACWKGLGVLVDFIPGFYVLFSSLYKLSSAVL